MSAASPPQPGRRAYTEKERRGIRLQLKSRYIWIEIQSAFGTAILFGLLASWVTGSATVFWAVATVGLFIGFGLARSWNRDQRLSIAGMSDDQLEVAKDEPRKKSTMGRVGGVIVLLVVYLAGSQIYSSAKKFAEERGGWENMWQVLQAVGSGTACEAVKVTHEVHIFIDKNGDPDFGYQVAVTVRNLNDKAGTFWLETTLTSSKEGIWIKRSLVDAAANAIQTWLIDYPEPTLASNNAQVQASILCFPSK
jgi:hypothetical protein